MVESTTAKFKPATVRSVPDDTGPLLQVVVMTGASNVRKVVREPTKEFTIKVTVCAAP